MNIDVDFGVDLDLDVDVDLHVLKSTHQSLSLCKCNFTMTSSFSNLLDPDIAVSKQFKSHYKLASFSTGFREESRTFKLILSVHLSRQGRPPVSLGIRRQADSSNKLFLFALHLNIR